MEHDELWIDYVADVRALTPTDAAKRVVPDAREQASQVRDALMRVRQSIVQRLAREEQSLADLRRRPVLRNPTGTLDIDLQRLADTRRRLALSVDALVAREQTSLAHALSGVRRMSPKATLDRGYAILVAGDGTSVTSIHDVDPDDDLLAYLADGKLVLSVRDIDYPPGVPTPDDTLDND